MYALFYATAHEKSVKMKLESEIEASVVRWAVARGILTSKYTGSAGYPDRIFWILGGAPVLIEFKRLGKYPGKLQAHIMDLLLENGYDVYLCESEGEAIACIDRAVHRACEKKAKKLSEARSRVVR